MEAEFTDVGSRARTGRRKGHQARRWPATAALLAGSLLLAVVVSGTASAAGAPAPQAVSRISAMSFGLFTFDAGGSVSFASSIACTSRNGCVGVFGLNFPQSDPLVRVTGDDTCTPSDNPTTCAIAFTGGDVIACTLTVYLPPVPGENNPVDLACSNPAGTGHGVGTLTVLT